MPGPFRGRGSQRESSSPVGGRPRLARRDRSVAGLQNLVATTEDLFVPLWSDLLVDKVPSQGSNDLWEVRCYRL